MFLDKICDNVDLIKSIYSVFIYLKLIFMNAREQVRALLAENGWKCNADGRRYVAERINHSFSPRNLRLKKWRHVLKYAEQVGGCRPGTSFDYINAQKEIVAAEVFDLYDIPSGLKNPFVVCFSGFMTAHLYTMEAVRFYAKTHGQLLPIYCVGKEGNKGLFKQVFDRTDGLMVQTEAEAYLRPLSLLAPKLWVRLYQRAVEDTDTKGNFSEMYNLAKALGLDEATFLLCSGNFSYDKRLLAEGMLELAKPEYADIKINLAVLHCPMCLNLSVPEGHLSELLLGYVAASLGPMLKDTTPLSTDILPDFTKERYLLPETEDEDWGCFRELITEYSNMGWPNYQELIYGIDHETAVENIILADLHARSSFSPEGYDEALRADIKKYQEFVGEYKQGTPFLEFLINSPDEGFF